MANDPTSQLGMKPPADADDVLEQPVSHDSDDTAKTAKTEEAASVGTNATVTATMEDCPVKEAVGAPATMADLPPPPENAENAHTPSWDTLLDLQKQDLIDVNFHCRLVLKRRGVKGKQGTRVYDDKRHDLHQALQEHLATSALSEILQQLSPKAPNAIDTPISVPMDAASVEATDHAGTAVPTLSARSSIKETVDPSETAIQLLRRLQDDKVIGNYTNDLNSSETLATMKMFSRNNPTKIALQFSLPKDARNKALMKERLAEEALRRIDQGQYKDCEDAASVGSSTAVSAVVPSAYDRLVALRDEGQITLKFKPGKATASKRANCFLEDQTNRSER
jgi:hypothetical protein